jgi:hypothetical protein
MTKAMRERPSLKGYDPKGAPHLADVARCGIPTVRFRLGEVLYQGTTLVVPYSQQKKWGFSP